MEYWEDRNCSKRYNEIIDATHEVFVKMDEGTATLEEYQEALQKEKELLSELAPEDFGLSNGDYFVDLTYSTRKLYKIEDGRLCRHDTNDWWYQTREETLRDAMSLTRKGKWMRFREAPLGN